MDLAEIERVIRVGMCAEKRMAECGCEWCSQRLAAVEAARAMHGRAERAEAEVERLRAAHQTEHEVGEIGWSANARNVAALTEARREVERLTRDRDEYRADVATARAALGPHATGDLVADVRRLVAREDVLRTYLARALRGCDPRERRAIEADLASEEREEVSDG